jgi:excisionase family DNA binding protein
MLRVAEVAQCLGISQALVYQLLAEGRIAHFRLGMGRGTIRIRSEDVDAYLAACRVSKSKGRESSTPKPTVPFLHLDAKKLANAWEKGS